MIESLSNLSIVGSGPSETIITCAASIGLVFVNVNHLSIMDLIIAACGLKDGYLDQAAHTIQKYVQLGPIYTLRTPTRRALIVAGCSRVSRGGGEGEHQHWFVVAFVRYSWEVSHR